MFNDALLFGTLQRDNLDVVAEFERLDVAAVVGAFQRDAGVTGRVLADSESMTRPRVTIGNLALEDGG